MHKFILFWMNLIVFEWFKWLMKTVQVLYILKLSSFNDLLSRTELKH